MAKCNVNDQRDFEDNVARQLVSFVSEGGTDYGDFLASSGLLLSSKSEKDTARKMFKFHLANKNHNFLQTVYQNAVMWQQIVLSMTNRADGVRRLENDLRAFGFKVTDDLSSYAKILTGKSKALTSIEKFRKFILGDIGTKQSTVSYSIAKSEPKATIRLSDDGWIKRMEKETGLTFKQYSRYVSAKSAREVNIRKRELYNENFNSKTEALQNKIEEARTPEALEKWEKRLDDHLESEQEPIMGSGMVDTRSDIDLLPDDIELPMIDTEVDKTVLGLKFGKKIKPRRMLKDEIMVIDEILNHDIYEGKEAVIRKYYNEIMKFRDDSIDRMVNKRKVNFKGKDVDRTGLLTEEDAENMKNGTRDGFTKFKWYVPRAVDKDYLEENSDRQVMLDTGIHALGDKEGHVFQKNYDPFATLMGHIENRYVAAEMNDAADSLAALIEEIGTLGFKTGSERVVREQSQPVMDDLGIKPVDFRTYLSPEDRENSIMFYRNGKRHRIILPRDILGRQHPLLRAFNYVQRDPIITGKISRYILGIMRNIITSKNPAFPPLNFHRDWQELNFVGVTLIKQQVPQLKNFRTEVNKNVPLTLGYMLGDFFSRGYLSKADRSKFAKYKKEARENGAFIAFKNYDGFTKEVKKLQKFFDKIDTKNVKSVKATSNLTRQALNGLDAWSDAWENATRFAVYVALRDQGVSILEASQLTRESTLNFEASGDSPVVDAFKNGFIFLNAGLQSMQRGFEALSTPEGAIVFVGLTMASAGMRSLFHFINDDDEDKDVLLDKIKAGDHTVIPLGKGISYTPPKPYTLYRMAMTIGEMIADQQVGYKDYTATQIIGEAMKSLFSGIDPIGFEKSATALIPTAMKPMGEGLVFNKGWTGSVIVPSFWADDLKTAPYEKKFASTTHMAEFISKWTYDKLDWNKTHAHVYNTPIVIDYITDQYLNMGALGEINRFLGQQFTDERGRPIRGGLHKALDRRLSGKTALLELDLYPERTSTPVIRRLVVGEGDPMNKAGSLLRNVYEDTAVDKITDSQINFTYRALATLKKEGRWSDRSINRFVSDFNKKFGTDLASPARKQTKRKKGKRRKSRPNRPK